MRMEASARFTTGIRDNLSQMQISVPIQRGNSGPVFDQAGNVIGMVVSKLDALKIAKRTGDLPQNVNFATLRRMPVSAANRIYRGRSFTIPS